MWKGLWNEQRKELIVHSYKKDGKQYTALFNAYRRIATKSNTKSVPVCSDYGMMLAACDQCNCQIKIRIWPLRHGGRGHMGEAGKFSSFAFGCVLQNTFNAYCVINNVDRHIIDYYYSFGKLLASQLYLYANTFNDTPVAQPNIYKM